MGWFVLLGVLAAFGAFSAVWAILGWLLPGAGGCALVCVGMPDEGIRSRYRWLRGMGLLNCPLIAVAEETKAVGKETEICSREDLLARLEWERNRFDGTGTGDSAGRGERGGVSEL